MYTNKTPISTPFNTNNSSRGSLPNPVFCVGVLKTSPTDMWRNIAKQISSRVPPNYRRNSSLSATQSFLAFTQASVFPNSRRICQLNSLSADALPVEGFQRNSDIDFHDKKIPSFSGRNQVNCYGLCGRTYASIAEAVEAEVAASQTDIDEDSRDSSADVPVPNEVEELLNVMRKEERRVYAKKWRHQRNMRMGNLKYYALKKRQAKIETEAWQQAAKEYVELLNDMCKQKLAPNLPYMKSLFLGWFEPLRDKIAEEQEVIRNGKSKAGYGKYFVLLPADMMAVVTMHKLMGLLMTGGDHGCARVVQAACAIGDAIEQEVRINYFLEKTKKRKADKAAAKAGDVSSVNSPEEEKLRKKVTTLVKKQNLRAVRQIVNRQIESQPWGQDARAKV